MSDRPDDMLSWLRSQIVARKATAEDLDGAAWGVYDYVTERPDGGGDEQVMLFDVAEDAELFSITIGATAANEDHLRHMALNDPQNTIARCDAELRIIALYEEDDRGRTPDYWEGLRFALDEIAYGYRHRPGWLPEWAPEPAGTVDAE